MMAAVQEEQVGKVVEEITFSCDICMESEGKEFVVYYPCLHYGCRECVGNWRTQNGEGDKFPCQKCRREVTVVAAGLAAYQDAQRINGQADYLKQALEELAVKFPNREASVQEAQPGIDHSKKYEEMVKNDRRCDWNCGTHRSCNTCGKRFMEIIKETAEKVFTGSILSLFIIPLHVFRLLKSVSPCFAAFYPLGKVKTEPEELENLRTDGWKAVLDQQKSIFPYKLRVASAFTLLALLLFFTGANVALVFDELSLKFIVSIVVGSLNLAFAITWLVFVILNLTKYRQLDRQVVRGGRHHMTYFVMEQIQQFIGELSAYPQLCGSAMLLHTHDVLVYMVFVLSAMILLAVFALRIYSVVKLKRFFHHYLCRLLFALVGNYLIVVFLVVMLIFSSFHDDSLAKLAVLISLPILIFFSNMWNMFMFYLSHLYEITLQSGLNLLSLRDDQYRDARPAIQSLLDYETFHKNMYTMSVPCYSVLVCFWLLPSALVLPFFIWLLDDAPTSTQLGLTIGYLFLLFVFNHKTFLIFMAGQFTVLVVCFLLAIVVALSGATAFSLYFSFFAMIALVVTLVMIVIVLLIIRSIWKCYHKPSRVAVVIVEVD